MRVGNTDQYNLRKNNLLLRKERIIEFLSTFLCDFWKKYVLCIFSNYSYSTNSKKVYVGLILKLFGLYFVF